MPLLNFEDLKTKKEKICVVGLGYVGLPLAAAFSKFYKVVGFDIDIKKIDELNNGKDRTDEVGTERLRTLGIDFTADPARIKEAKFIVLAIPTPIDENRDPDLSLVEKATVTVGKNLALGSVVVYESTVYPGVTEEICVPILERESGLKCGTDFKIGYSPERINPGDKEHTIDKIIKVVSGMDDESLELISDVYGSITIGGTYKAKSIKVAEAAKVIENTQRDLNVALMNELAIIFHRMDLSIYDVLEASGTKWNFLKFFPGLVGGHCIGVDPYYLTYKAQSLGHHPEVILSGRRINDSMARYIGRQILKQMAKMDKIISTARVAILGFTFKEDVPDVRNSKVFDLYKELKEFGLSPLVYDPIANKDDVKHEYGIELCNLEDLKNLDTIIVAVAHKEFKSMEAEDYRKLMNTHKLLLADIKHIFKRENYEKLGINYWSL